MRLEFAQKAFIVDDARLLLVRKSATDPAHPLQWEVPGGRARFGEEVAEHICREVWEEVGISIVPGRPFHVWQWLLVDQHGERVQFYAVARVCTPTSVDVSAANRVAGDHLGEIRWVPFAELAGYELIPNLKPVVEDFLENCVGSSTGFAVPEVVNARHRPSPGAARA